MLIQAIVESYRVVFDHAAKRANPRISANSFIRIAGTLMTDKQHLSFSSFLSYSLVCIEW